MRKAALRWSHPLLIVLASNEPSCPSLGDREPHSKAVPFSNEKAAKSRTVGESLRNNAEESQYSTV